MMFGGKSGEHTLAETMKEKCKLVKEPWDYAILIICDPVVMVAMQILAGKVMRKCRIDEVSVPVVALVAQCAEGVQFNCASYLCGGSYCPLC